MEGQSYVISDERASAQAQSCPLDDEKQPLRAAARKLRGSGFYQNLRCATNKI